MKPNNFLLAARQIERSEDARGHYSCVLLDALRKEASPETEFFVSLYADEDGRFGGHGTFNGSHFLPGNERFDYPAANAHRIIALLMAYQIAKSPARAKRTPRHE